MEYVPKKGIFFSYWIEGKSGPLAQAHKDIDVTEVYIDGKKIWDKEPSVWKPKEEPK